MRDFRDAKAMARTLRDLLTAKSISVTHSESLELIAKILGFQDWNVLSAEIEASIVQSNKTSPKELPSSEPRREITVDAAILDGYVGFYQLGNRLTYTVTRDGGHLLTRITGQDDVPFYAQSNTEFFAKVVDAQVKFIVDESGHALSLVQSQGGSDYPMKRVDAATAQRLEADVAEKMRSQSATPGTEEALLRLIEGLTSGKPNYHEMGPDLAEATRQQLSHLHPGHEQLGAVETVRFLGVDSEGKDVYTVRHANGASHWRIALDSKGLIDTAWVTPGP